jgi:hypothetical protein
MRPKPNMTQRCELISYALPLGAMGDYTFVSVVYAFSVNLDYVIFLDCDFCTTPGKSEAIE